MLKSQIIFFFIFIVTFSSCFENNIKNVDGEVHFLDFTAPSGNIEAKLGISELRVLKGYDDNISELREFLITKQYYIIVETSNYGRILFFNRNSGSFSHKIDPVGQGPEMLPSLTNIAIDGKSIICYSSDQNRFVIYNEEGTNPLSYESESYGESIVFDKNLYLYRSNNFSDERDKFNLIKYNDEFHITSRLDEYNHDVSIGLNMSGFLYKSDATLYAPTFSDTIFQMIDDELKSKFIFEFPKSRIDLSEFDNNNLQELFQRLPIGTFLTNYAVLGDNYLLGFVVVDGKKEIYLYNSESRELSSSLGGNSSEFMKLFYYDRHLLAYDGNHFLLLLDNESFKELDETTDIFSSINKINHDAKNDLVLVYFSI